MSVEDMKMEAVKKINQLQSKASVQEILNHLETLNDVIKHEKISAEEVFNEAQKKYDNF